MTGFTWPQELTTERLRLRRVRIDDAKAVFAAYATDERVTRFMTWRPHESVTTVRAFLADLVGRGDRGEEIAWVIVHDDELVGMVTVRLHAHVVELGYVLAHDRWNAGLMSEAVTEVVAVARRDPEVHRIWSCHDVDNPASGRVMEKAGLQHEGRLRRWITHPNVSDTPRDVEAYSWVR